MPTRHAFDYAVLRVVPRVEREEFVNVGVILHCGGLRYLNMKVQVDERRVLALDPGCHLATVGAHLQALMRICAGDAGASPLAQGSRLERFHWLTSPRSTVIQVSPVHSGLCQDPAQALDDLFEKLVALPNQGESPIQECTS